MLTSEELRFLALLAAQGSLAAAARALGVTPPAVTQRLQALEARAGVRLLERGARRVHPTAEGELLLAEAAELLPRLDALAERLRERGGRVTGELRVLAPFGFGRRHVAGLVAAFQDQNPQLRVSLTLSERPALAAREGFDVALHIGHLRDSAMVATRLAPNARFACASPAYLKRAGRPRRPAELARHRCLVIRENDEDVTVWRFRQGAANESVRVEPALASNDGEVVRDWVLAGRGIAIRSEWDVAAALREGRLVRVLPSWSLPDAPVVALAPARHALPARSRAFVAFLRERLSPPPWR